jgi:hypothetical protein
MYADNLFLEPAWPGTAFGLDIEIEEAAPDAPGAEEWILKHKDEFKKRYGQNWAHVLYGKAWHIFGDKAVNKKAVHECVDDPAELLSEKAWWDKYERRSLTAEESKQLKVPKSELGCSVMYFEDKKGKKKGYIAYTHRAASGFYDNPGDIPASKLKFISSTA